MMHKWTRDFFKLRVPRNKLTQKYTMKGNALKVEQRLAEMTYLGIKDLLKYKLAAYIKRGRNNC